MLVTDAVPSEVSNVLMAIMTRMCPFNYSDAGQYKSLVPVTNFP